LTDAIAETAKYITKPTSMEHLPIEQIMEITNYLKGKRMIEPLGEANERKGKVKPKQTVLETDSDSLTQESISISEQTDETDTSVLNTKTIESFTRLKSACLTLIRGGERGEAEARIKRAFDKRRAYRRRQLSRMYPTAEFMTLSGEVFCFDDYESSDFRETFNVR
jgi:hypothetical protein